MNNHTTYSPKEFFYDQSFDDYIEVGPLYNLKVIGFTSNAIGLTWLPHARLAVVHEQILPYGLQVISGVQANVGDIVLYAREGIHSGIYIVYPQHWDKLNNEIPGSAIYVIEGSNTGVYVTNGEGYWLKITNTND